MWSEDIAVETKISTFQSSVCLSLCEGNGILSSYFEDRTSDWKRTMK
jgi:hypothetical protein